MIIYAKPEQPEPLACARGQWIDPVLVAGLLRAAGVRGLRLLDGGRDARLREQLRACGLEVAFEHEDRHRGWIIRVPPRARTCWGAHSGPSSRGFSTATSPVDVDLAQLGAAVLDPDDERAKSAVADVVGGEVLVLASPTYKATYSGLLKAFLDRLGTGALAGAAAVPILLAGAQNHRLAIDVHFVPLLYELGARVPARGLFVLESELGQFPIVAEQWAEAHARTLLDPLQSLTADRGGNGGVVIRSADRPLGQKSH